MDVLVLDSTEEDFGKHAYSQLKEYKLDVNVKKADFIDLPGIISRSESKAFLIICDTNEDYMEPVIDKILQLEIEKGIIQKVFLDSSGKSQEIFNRQARRKAGEAAEKLQEKVKN